MKKISKGIAILSAISVLSVCCLSGCSSNGNSYIWKCTRDNSSYVKADKNASQSSGSVQLTKFYFPEIGFIVTGGANYTLSGNKFTKLHVTTGYYRNQDMARVMSITKSSNFNEIYVKYGKTQYTYK